MQAGLEKEAVEATPARLGTALALAGRPVAHHIEPSQFRGSSGLDLRG